MSNPVHRHHISCQSSLERRILHLSRKQRNLRRCLALTETGALGSLGLPPPRAVDTTMSRQKRPRYATAEQGQYLAFIYTSTRGSRRPPAVANIQHFFGATLPTAQNMVVRLTQLPRVIHAAYCAMPVQALRRRPLRPTPASRPRERGLYPGIRGHESSSTPLATGGSHDEPGV